MMVIWIRKGQIDHTLPSAKSLIVLFVKQIAMSIIYKMKNFGPSTLSCGTPEVTIIGAKSKNTPSLITGREPPVKNCETHEIIQGYIFSTINLCTRM